jgi:hypothetical protein
VVTADEPERMQCEVDPFDAFRDWLRWQLRDAGCEIRTLSPEGMAEVTVRRFAEEGWRVLPPGSAIVEAQLAYERGLREATEGWDREWLVNHPPYGGADCFVTEGLAREEAARVGRPVFVRLVGPWEPAGQPEPVSPRRRPHQPDDIEVLKSRSAGWVFRCHRCDITSANLDEHGARQRATDHLHLEAPELLHAEHPEPAPDRSDRYMMATTAIHKLGDISRDEPALAVIYGETETDWIGQWVAGLGMVNVRFPKATTRELTEDERAFYRTKVVQVGSAVERIRIDAEQPEGSDRG